MDRKPGFLKPSQFNVVKATSEKKVEAVKSKASGDLERPEDVGATALPCVQDRRVVGRDDELPGGVLGHHSGEGRFAVDSWPNSCV